MDATTAIVVDAGELFGVVERVWWVALRVGAMMMLAPMVGTRMLPMRVRLIVTLALSVALAPLVSHAAPAIALDAPTLLAMARELAIGAAIGFTFRLGFEAFAFAGELISQGMGLSFAQMLDPLRGAQSPVMSTWFSIIAGLTFFAIDGHLALVRVVLESYGFAAAGTTQTAHLLAAVPAFGQSMLAAGLSLALPVVIAMLVVNIAFGVLARTAPALNPIAIGLPAALLMGFVLLIALIPRLAAPLHDWLATMTAAAAAAVR
ncbi:MAG TPA: flagellar biosynthetic protein FliR [Rudaea sp.]